MLHSILDKLTDNLETVSAHCDIPCKVYDPYMAQFAAISVIRFLDLIAEIGAKDTLTVTDMIQLARLTEDKEAHAEKAKQEIRVIWGDYFKAPQIEQFPKIHELTHQIMLAGSACKQGTERDKGEKLLNLINEFSTAFWTTKSVETYTATCPFPPSVEVVYPKLDG